jgi:hypothetical protein
LNRQSDCIVSNPRIFEDEAIQVLLRKKKFESTKQKHRFKPQKLLAIAIQLLLLLLLLEAIV